MKHCGQSGGSFMLDKTYSPARGMLSLVSPRSPQIDGTVMTTCMEGSELTTDPAMTAIHATFCAYIRTFHQPSLCNDSIDILYMILGRKASISNSSLHYGRDTKVILPLRFLKERCMYNCCCIASYLYSLRLLLRPSCPQEVYEYPLS